MEGKERKSVEPRRKMISFLQKSISKTEVQLKELKDSFSENESEYQYNFEYRSVLESMLFKTKFEMVRPQILFGQKNDLIDAVEPEAC